MHTLLFSINPRGSIIHDCLGDLRLGILIRRISITNEDEREGIQ